MGNHLRPATAGERLFLFILNEISAPDMGAYHGIIYGQIGGRNSDMFNFFVEINALNVLARLVRLAVHIQEKYNALDHKSEMIKYIQLKLGIAGQDDTLLERLAALALGAGVVSKQKPSPSTKKLVRNGATELPCYICGALCEDKKGVENQVQYEHLWPRSHGGDSSVDNLLPACKYCNQPKGAMLLWHTAEIFGTVLPPSPSDESFKLIRRREKIASYMKRVYDHANLEGCTLKEAAQFLGPGRMSPVQVVDDLDAVDFFNFTVA